MKAPFEATRSTACMISANSSGSRWSIQLSVTLPERADSVTGGMLIYVVPLVAAPNPRSEPGPSLDTSCAQSNARPPAFLPRAWDRSPRRERGPPPMLGPSESCVGARHEQPLLEQRGGRLRERRD